MMRSPAEKKLVRGVEYPVSMKLFAGYVYYLARGPGNILRNTDTSTWQPDR